VTVAAPICVARIGAAHGVRGAVKLWTFTEDPMAVKHYGPLTTKDGARQFELTHVREARDHLVATLNSTSRAKNCLPPMTTNITTPT
jgi:16S rRNA processing protein RimM